MTSKIRLDVGMVLEQIPDPPEDCVERLAAAVKEAPGINRAHVLSPDVPGAEVLCVHFDSMLSEADLQRIVSQAAARVAEQCVRARQPDRSGA